MAYVEDDEIYPVMIELAACLALEIETAELPKPCRVGVKPGDVSTLDFGPAQLAQKKGNGQGWVRLVGAGAAFPTDANAVALLTNVRCGAANAYELEIGLSRCEPQGKTVNNVFIPPTAEEELESVRLYGGDRRAMKRAVLCCLTDRLGDGYEVGLGLYQPLPSTGGVGGGTWQVFVRRA